MTEDLQRFISNHLRVDIISGECFWIKAPAFHPEVIGKSAGSIVSNKGQDRIAISANGKKVKRAQVVFFVATGVWPTGIVDHINGNTMDDRIENLREVTVSENAKNSDRRTNRLKTKRGVRKLPSGKFQSRITVDRSLITIGVFESEHDAHVAYIEKRKEAFGEFARA